MELDKRIKEGKRPLTALDTDVAKEFIGKQCYFADNIEDFSNLDNVSVIKGFLTDIDDDEMISGCFKSNGIRSSFFSHFIVPCEWVKEEKKEPKYRPYTIKDFEEAFLKDEFEDFIIFREKDNPDNVYTMRYNGNFRKGGFDYICLGAKNFSFESLFENYEVANYDGDFVPFGVLEDD